LLKKLIPFLILLSIIPTSKGFTNPFNEEFKQEVTITIIDPNTGDEVKTFQPSHIELSMDLAYFKQQVENWIHEIESIYSKEMVLDKIDDEGKIIKGRPKIGLNKEVLVETIVEHSFTGGEIPLPFYVTESGYKEEDVPHLEEVVLASYTTYFNPLKVGRSKNIELSALAIHNVIVGSVDVFSFNSVVGPREIAYGYRMAPEIVKGKVVMGVGGGICQTSSTLFNAVDQLNLEIVERHHHSMDVGYVPKGRDATVSFGGLDFRFQNNMGIPLLIKAYYKPGSVTVEVRTSREYRDFYEYELS